MSEMPTSMMTDLTPETAVLVRLLAEQQALIENLRREKDEVAKLLSGKRPANRTPRRQASGFGSDVDQVACGFQTSGSS